MKSVPSVWLFGLLAALIFLTAPRTASAQTTVTLDGSTTYQTIDGFGCNLRGGDDTNQTAPVLEGLVGAGLTLFRLIQDEQDYIPSPGDHSVYSTGYFTNLVGTIAYLNQLGITNGIHLNFMGTGQPYMVTGSGTSTFLAVGQETNWADMVGSLVAYLKLTNHLQFSLLEPENESDQTPGTLNKPRLQPTASGGATGRTEAYHALATYLNNNGLSDVRIVGLSTAFVHTDWISLLMSDPLVRSMVTHIGLHSYADDMSGAAGMASFLQSNFPGTNFWMTEYSSWCYSCEGGGAPNTSWAFARTTASDLINHLANGAAGCEIFTGCDTQMKYLNAGSGGWSFWGVYGCDNINAPFKTYTPRYTFYTLAQVSKFVKPGAQRIGIAGYTSPFNLVAFRHPTSGQVVVTGVNPSGDTPLSCTLASLPPVASLDLYYTTSTTNLAFGGRISVANGSFTTTIPEDSVFTLVGTPAVSVRLTNPPNQASYGEPATLTLQAEASTAIGSLGPVQFFNGTTLLGQADAAPYSLIWSNVSAGAYVLTALVTNSVGNSAVSSNVHVTVVGPMAQIRVTPPSALVQPYTQQPFAAVAVDAAGNTLNPQPLFSWAVSAGGSIDTNGTFAAGGIPGGPFSVSASAYGFTGLSQVSIATNGTPFLPLQSPRIVNAGATLVVTNTALAGPFATQWLTNEFAFAYSNRDALLADGWSFIATRPDGTARNTEITNPALGAVVSYDQASHPGVLRIPCDQGDLWGLTSPTSNNSRNSLVRSLPTNWLSVELTMSFTPTANYQQAHFGLYQDDDNYLELGTAYNSYRQPPGEWMTLTQESNGVPSTLVGFPSAATNLRFRLQQSPATGTTTGLYSLDGTTWTVLGTSTAPLLHPRLFLWTGGAQSAYSSGMPTMDLRQLAIVQSNAVPRTLTYTLLNPPVGASIDTNGVITWNPTAAQAPSTNVLTTVVTDNGMPPLTLSNSFVVIVNQLNAFPIRSVALNGNAVAITWESLAGQTYRLQYKDDLTDTNWQDVLPDILGSGTWVTTTNAVGNSSCRFFRLTLVP